VLGAAENGEEKKRDETAAQLLLRTVDADFKCNLLRVCVASFGRRPASRRQPRAIEQRS